MNEPIMTSPIEAEAHGFMSSVYGWMTAGLALTGFVSMYLASNPAVVMGLMQTRFLMMGLIIVELGLVVALSALAQRVSASTATALFLSYAALNGVTLSVIFLVYTRASIASTFFITAGTFGAMSLYGYTTKRDLTTMGHLCFMGLIGIIIASLVNFFFKNPTVYWVTTYLGVLIFVGLTAYDTQKIKNLYVAGDEEADKKEAVIGALILYLDFVNLFIELLSIMGKRRD